MKKRMMIWLLALMPLTAMAQTASSVLDKAAAAFKSAGGIKATYTYTVGGETGAGTIKLKGQKFNNDLGNHVFWFDGTTLWTLVKSNEEVNVTNPTAKEIARMNPYSFVSLYKKDYTAKMTGKSTKEHYEVLLTAKQASTSIKSILMRINRTNNQPTYVKMVSQDGVETEITVNSLVKGQNYTDATFVFNPKSYPNVEVVDLR